MFDLKFITRKYSGSEREGRRVFSVREELEKLKEWNSSKSRSINRERSVEFAEKVVGYEGERLEKLKRGVKIEAEVRRGETYEEGNNKSGIKRIFYVATKHKKFSSLHNMIFEWYSQIIIVQMIVWSKGCFQVLNIYGED